MKQLIVFLLFFNLFFAKGMSKAEVNSYVDSLGFPKWYYKIKNIDKMKDAFIQILEPLIQKENQKIKQERLRVIEIFKKSFFAWSRKDVLFLIRLSKKYKIKSIYHFKEFLKKVAPIPLDLVLAQAAIESAWGKSRFTKEANNIFGQWTFGKLGIVPKNRDEGKNHKLRVFKNLSASIWAYMRNLNRNLAYRDFREARYRSIKRHTPFSAFEAAKHLRHYSQIGEKYIKILNHTIATIISHKKRVKNSLIFGN